MGRRDVSNNFYNRTINGASSRREFLKFSGITLAALLVGCGGGGGGYKRSGGFDLGSGDIGILNYAYALEQLEAAFYIRVLSTPYSGIRAAERSILTDIRDHEVIHRDFLKVALGSEAIANLEFDFSSIDFSNRSSVLNAAKNFEDLGVSAYNGAGRFIEDPDYLVLAGKIVSVEARHASAIRALLSPKSTSFAGDDVVDPSSGLDKAEGFDAVLGAAGSLITSPVDASHLPN
jgi:hypothetical protein